MKLAIISIIFVLIAVIWGTGSCVADIQCAPSDTLTETVIKSDLIVLGSITDNRTEVVTVLSEHPGKFAYTIFTLSVEKVIKGNPDINEVLIKVEGGAIGEVDQVSTGVYFLMSDRILVALHLEEDNVYTVLPSGLVWAERPTIGATPVQSLPDSIRRIIQIMMAHNIPIVLPASEWPSMFVPVPVSPAKS
jgi:hypothetical protein